MEGKNIICIPDAKGRKMYYNKILLNLEFIGYETTMDKYVEKYKLVKPECDRPPLRKSIRCITKL